MTDQGGEEGTIESRRWVDLQHLDAARSGDSVRHMREVEAETERRYVNTGSRVFLHRLRSLTASLSGRTPGGSDA